MPEISDAALPWLLLVGSLAVGVIGGAVVVYADRVIRYGGRWLAGRLSGLPVLTAPLGCDDCSAKHGEPHRYAGCPGNVRQHEDNLGLGRVKTSSSDGPS